jgi:hypothetical protein
MTSGFLQLESTLGTYFISNTNLRGDYGASLVGKQ